MADLRDGRGAAPSVTIEAALELYIANLFPAGLPPGVDKRALMEAITERVKRERPEWAASSYAQQKRALTQQPGDDVPTDPNDRYFYERDLERAARLQERREAATEAQLKEGALDARRARQSDEQSSVEGRRELARRAIEQRVAQLREATKPASRSQPLSSTMDAEWDAALKWSELSEQERKVEVLRLWNRRRMEALRNKSEVLAPRWPRAQAMDDDDGGSSALSFSERRHVRRAERLEIDFE